MGLLDDAIREHLDLKRRRGADPAEIERAEREALGPVRRAPEPQEADEPGLAQQAPYDEQVGDAAPGEDELAWDGGLEDERGGFEPFDHEPEPESRPPSAAEPEFDEPPPPRAASQAAEAPMQHMPLPDDEADDDFEEPSGAAPPRPHPAAAPPADGSPPADEPPPRSRPPADHAGGETVEYEVEGEFAEEGEHKADDVLEETPEFLQDTPDHDRLWFEQRPPKDFDFDG
jgi:hypothetical protein